MRNGDEEIRNVELSSYSVHVPLTPDNSSPTKLAGDFDHSKWLFETKESYGYYGNNVNSSPEELEEEEDGDRESEALTEVQKSTPLTTTTKVSVLILTFYRLLALIRMVLLGLFLQWRLTHPNDDAIWLWSISVACESWFALSWLLDQLPKLCPIHRTTNPNSLPLDLPGIDVFVSTADPEKEPPLVTANTVLSILAANYPADRLACYVSDDGGALLTFEASAEAASFAGLWVPFCRKHGIEPRNPEAYFGLKRDPYKGKVRHDFVRDRRRVKREYVEFKVRVNALTDSIRRRSEAYNMREEMNMMKARREKEIDDDAEEEEETIKAVKATWMSDGTHWPGTWTVPSQYHSRGDHASILQVMVKSPSENEPLEYAADNSDSDSDSNSIDFSSIDTRVPMLVYMSREKRPGYDHNKKAGAMNALVRASAVMSNGPFILNLDCDHYINDSGALKEGMCFMMDGSAGGDNISFVQFPQRFEGVDPSDRYANRNTVFFDVNMRALDGLQGPVYVGTGCLFRRTALYAFDPPLPVSTTPSWHSRLFHRRKKSPVNDEEANNFLVNSAILSPKVFGNSRPFLASIPLAESQGRTLGGRPFGASLTAAAEAPARVGEAVSVVSCWYEDKTEWGQSVGWIYGSVTEDVVTGYRMHRRGWRSVYCAPAATRSDAFRGTAPINLTDRLHQVLRWATGSVEIFFSRNNALLAGPRMNILQQIAYLNVGVYPFTSIFLVAYCFLPALSLFSGEFIVPSVDTLFLSYLLGITLTMVGLAVMEIKWSGIGLEEWWRNEQFWLIGGTSAHLAAVFQGLLKVIGGIEISFTLTSKSSSSDGDPNDEFAELYEFKWTALMVLPITIMMTNLIAVASAACRAIYSVQPRWSTLLGGVFFSFWVLVHLYPFAKGLMGRRSKTPTIVFVWSGLLAIAISLLWVAIDPPSQTDQIGGSFQLF